MFSWLCLTWSILYFCFYILVWYHFIFSLNLFYLHNLHNTFKFDLPYQACCILFLLWDQTKIPVQVLSALHVLNQAYNSTYLFPFFINIDFLHCPIPLQYSYSWFNTYIVYTLVNTTCDTNIKDLTFPFFHLLSLTSYS